MFNFLNLDKLTQKKFVVEKDGGLMDGKRDYWLAHSGLNSLSVDAVLDVVNSKHPYVEIHLHQPASEIIKILKFLEDQNLYALVEEPKDGYSIVFVSKDLEDFTKYSKNKS